jgi:hypothetical protein
MNKPGSSADTSSYLESILAQPKLEAAVAAPAATKPATTTPAEMSAAKASPAVLSGLEAAFAANCVNEAAAFMKSNFPITPEALIVRTKEVLTLGIGTKDEGACIADGFEFCAPVIGPLPKDEYLAALNGFKLEDTFDLNAQYHLFRVDPTQPNRVWFHTRTLGTHVSDSPLFGPASGKEIVNPPQCMHMDFTEAGLVKEFGFYTVDRRQGNTGGLGGAFAFFYGVGRPLPFPEAKPFKRSKRFRLFQFIGNVASRFSKKKE